MNFIITKNSENSLTRLRRLGYAAYRNRQGKESFVKRIAGGNFPRFHLYITKEDGGNLSCSLHIDQTAPVYGRGNAHRGDYESPVVSAEVSRIETTNTK